MMKITNKELGNWGEQAAAEYLHKYGLRILERNFKCRLGEIDIIALDKGNLIFVEVKTRSSDRFGSPAEAVNSRKRKKYKLIALHYLNTIEKYDYSLRFDVVEIELTVNGTHRINHIQNAFC